MDVARTELVAVKTISPLILGLGDGAVALVSAAVIVVLVAYLARTRHGVQRVEAPVGVRDLAGS